MNSKISEAERRTREIARGRCWLWAERLYIRWHSMHGLSNSKEAWEKLNEWDKSYWYGVAEFVFENFEEKNK
jgi:hypothetical protein